MKLGTTIFIIAAGIVGYGLYKRYKEISSIVDNTLDKVSEGAKDLTELLKRENEILEMKIQDKKVINK